MLLTAVVSGGNGIAIVSPSCLRADAVGMV